MVVL
jgi:hypothetical protein